MMQPIQAQMHQPKMPGKNAVLPVQPITMDKDQLNFWKAEVKSSLQRQKREFIDRVGYAELVRYFEALQYPGSKSLLAIVDEFSPAILSVITNTYYQNPTVQVEAGNPQADGMVQPSMLYLLQHPEFRPFSLVDLLKSGLSYGMTKSGMKEEMQIGTFDLLLAGYAAIEMNHTSTADEAPQSDASHPDETPMGEQAENIIQAMVNGAKGIVGKLTGSKNPEEVEDEVMEDTQSNLRTDFTDKTYCKRYNPLDILFDPRAEVFKESRWVGKRIRMTVSEFNAKYPKFKGKVLAGDNENNSLEFGDSYNSKDNKKCVSLYEVEIKKKGPRNCVLVLHPALDEPVDYYERAIITNKFAIKYGAIDKYGKIYPMSRGRKAKGPQDDINHYMTIQFEHVDRAQRKIAVYMDGLTESGKSAQRSADVYAIVDKSTPSPVYEPMPAPSVVPENKEIIAMMTASINKSVGTTELAKTGESENDTLGQDQLQTQAFQVNVNSVQDALQDLADQLIDELKDIQQQVWDGEDYFKVSGITGGDAWYEPSMGPLADILVGDYQVRCNIASSARPDPMRDRQRLMEATNLLISPQVVQFSAIHGKRPSMETLNNLVKAFDMNPEMVFETLEPILPQGLPGQPSTVTPPQQTVGQVPGPIPVPQAESVG